jgi:23S rRNA (cytidine1920-2'-O)/16S rRNA (cytidine1409-2'-O)-methyltransferase
LEDFAFVVRGLNCLDVGASTGGFTNCLLQQGAAHVSSVDVGYGQFAWQLRTDERVSLFERTNIKDVDTNLLSRAPFDLIVVDLSFISLRALLARLAFLLASGGTLIALIKPQFELAREAVEKGGVVTDAKAHDEALVLVIEAAQAAGLAPLAAACSHLKGPKGNIEFFLRAQKDGVPVTIDTAKLVQKAHASLSPGTKSQGLVVN